jgi:hypothetical protein
MPRGPPAVTTNPPKKDATYDDLRDVPDHFVAEMLDGESTRRRGRRCRTRTPPARCSPKSASRFTGRAPADGSLCSSPSFTSEAMY